METIIVEWISGEYNLADLFTKTTMTRELKHRLVHNIFKNDAAPIEVKMQVLPFGIPPGIALKPGLE